MCGGGVYINDVAAVGMCTYDEFVLLDSYPKEDKKYIARDVAFRYGGMAANVAVDLSKLGLHTALISVIGCDKIGEEALKHLAKEGVDTSGVRTIDKDTQRTCIIVNKRNASRTAIAKQLLRITNPDDVQRNVIRNSRMIYLDGTVDPEVCNDILADARKYNCETFYSLELSTREGLEFFQQCDYGIMSEQVANELDLASPYKLVLKKLWRNESKLKGITRGRKGNLFYDGRNFIRGLVYIPHTCTIDSTGAGDAFQAGIIFGVLNNFELKFTLDIASVMAGLTCTTIGAHAYDFDLKEIISIAKNPHISKK
jgi:ribokinase